MQNFNYVILIDENGQPYLAHSIWDRAKSAYGSARSAAGKAYGSARSAGNRAVKYIEKIGDGAKARYFYTKDELQAYYDNMRGKAKDAAQQAKQKAQKVAERAKVETRYAVGSAQKEARDRAYDEMVRASRDAGRTQVRGASNSSAARQAASDARKAHDTAHEARTRQIDEYVGARASDREASRQLSRAAAAKEAADKNASRWITTRKDYDEAAKANEAYERALDDRRRAASEKRMTEQAMDKARRDDNKAYSDYLERQNDVRRADLKERDDNRRAQDAADVAKERYDALEREYANTPLAKVEAAKDFVIDYASEKIDSIKDWYNKRQTQITNVDPAENKPPIIRESRAESIKNAVDSAKDKATSAADKVKSAYDRMREAFAKRNQPPTPKLSPEGAETIIPETIIPETIIPENIIEEKRIPEQRIEEKRIPEQRIEEKKVEEQRTEEEPWTSKDYQEALEYNSRKNNYFGTGETYPRSSEKTSNPRNDKIDASKVSTEYVYAVGSNTGHASDVNKVMQAEDAYNRAMREYSRISAAKNASGQDKSAAKREMDKLKKEYEELFNDLVDTLNNE